MKLLFHCCCGPCAVACIDSLASEEITPALFWFNPNIHPLAEYQNRRDSLFSFAKTNNLKLESIDEYGLRTFLAQTGEEIPPVRCEICYRIRLEKTAEYAAKNGFGSFSTSLLVSPYQQHDTIRRIGEEAAEKYGIKFFYRDFRLLFRQGQVKARSFGLYMQKYCGCIFSEEEKFIGKKLTPRRKDAEEEKSAPSRDKTSTDFFFQRLVLLTGEETLKKLQQTSVLVFGIGGVGSWCAEALVRSGVGKIGIVDFDTVCESNINRQVQATNRTIGFVKTEALKQRLLEINPNCEVTAWAKMFTKENAGEFEIEKAGYVIDAIDTLPHKLDLIEYCSAGNNQLKFFSSMGMARRMNPVFIKTGSIWESRGCPLARLVRQSLKKRGFSGDFTVVYNDEPPAGNAINFPSSSKKIMGSVVTVTAAAGMTLASLVLRDITERQ